MIKTGLLLVSLGALSSVMQSSTLPCILSEWFILLGYTMLLSPVFIKISTVNKIARHSREFRHVDVDSRHLVLSPFYLLVPVIAFLTVWTTLDRPTLTETLSLQYEFGHIGNDTILVNYYCSSLSPMWRYASYTWQFFLLFSASLLSIQSLKIEVAEEMRESKALGFIVYSQSIFLLIRIGLILFINDDEQKDQMAYIFSIILSLDVMNVTAIYVGPKFSSSGSFSQRRSSVLSFASSFHNFSPQNSLRSSRRIDFESYQVIMNTLGLDVDSFSDRGSMSGFKELRQSGIYVIKPKIESSGREMSLGGCEDENDLF